MTGDSRADLRKVDLYKDVADLGPWFHNLHLLDGTQTAPEHFLGDFPMFKWRDLSPHLSADLRGLSALDVGCNAGFYSFELAKRGAKVTGIDADPRYLKQAQWAARHYGLEDKVTFKQMQVYDLAHTKDKYDLVLFMGVFYHLRYPLLGLDIVAQKVRRTLVFQTLTVPGGETPVDIQIDNISDRARLLEPGWPKLAFFEHAFGGDPTNWWAANHAGVKALLRSAGLKVTSEPAHEFYLCEPDPDHPSCVSTWNRAELLAATGRREV